MMSRSMLAQVEADEEQTEARRSKATGIKVKRDARGRARRCRAKKEEGLQGGYDPEALVEHGLRQGCRNGGESAAPEIP